MGVNTQGLIEELTTTVNDIVPAYYEDAPENAALPFCVINNPIVSDLATGDLVSFYIDIWADERKPNAAVELEFTCDILRNRLNGLIISRENSFSGHLNFEKQFAVSDTEQDLLHRRQSWTARVFYI